MKENTFTIIKKVLNIVIFIIIVIVFVILLMFSSDNNKISVIQEFIKNDVKVLYISDELNYSDYPIELFKKYEIEFLNINSDELNIFEKSKIEKIINSQYLSDIIIIYQNGKIIDKIVNYESERKLNTILQKLNILPEVIGDVKGIIESVPDLLESDLSILYFPYEYVDGIETQSKILEEIAKEYNSEYKMIDAYLLSSTQKQKLNSILQISEVEDQIIILVQNQKIIGSIRGINTKNEYLKNLEDFEFIDEIDNYIKDIDYDEFENLVNSQEKSIILIGKDNCKYCDEVMNILNTIIIDYDIEINYLNIKDFESDISEKVEQKIIELGYEDGFTTPIILLIESNKLLDYVIGSSDEKYFVDIFTENGIIK